MEEKLHEPAKISTTQGARPSGLRAGVQTKGLAEAAQGQTQKAQRPWEELLGEKRWAAQGQTQQAQGPWEELLGEKRWAAQRRTQQAQGPGNPH